MVIVVEEVADVGVVDAGEQGEDSLLMDGSATTRRSRTSPATSPGTSTWTACCSLRARVPSCSTAPQTATSASTPTRTASTYFGARVIIWVSAPGPTHASAGISPGWRCWLCSPPRSPSAASVDETHANQAGSHRTTVSGWTLPGSYGVGGGVATEVTLPRARSVDDGSDAWIRPAGQRIGGPGPVVAIHLARRGSADASG